ncbi:MAG: hypothetical protein KGI34_24185 [Bradyrhizobium sp.]|nr:hypothetical protein [Bradyrhizobium sp.]
MSRLIMGISGVLALSLISGAAEFARGRDLVPTAGSLISGNSAPVTQGLSLLSSVSQGGMSSVNRAAKADRSAVPAAAASTRTVSLRLDGFADTTFLVRIPVVTANPPPVPVPAKPATAHKSKLACEPVVSILTEVAKRLEPGRCVA